MDCLAYRPDCLCSSNVLPADSRNRFFHGICPLHHNSSKGAYRASCVPYVSYAPGGLLPSPLEHPSFVGLAKWAAVSDPGFFAAFLSGRSWERLRGLDQPIFLKNGSLTRKN